MLFMDSSHTSALSFLIPRSCLCHLVKMPSCRMSMLVIIRFGSFATTWQCNWSRRMLPQVCRALMEVVGVDAFATSTYFRLFVQCCRTEPRCCVACCRPERVKPLDYSTSRLVTLSGGDPSSQVCQYGYTATWPHGVICMSRCVRYERQQLNIIPE